jgi:hypothetical protein
MAVTRVKLDFVVEHPGDVMLSSFNILDFVAAGLKKVKLVDKHNGTAIRPGARLSLTKQRR